MHSFAPSLSFLLSFLLLPLLRPQAGPSNSDGFIQPAVKLGLGLQFARGVELYNSLIQSDDDAEDHHSTGGAVNLDLGDTGASTFGGRSHVAPPLRRRHAALSHARALNQTEDGNSYTRSLYLGRRTAGAQFTNFVTGLGACGGFNQPSDYVVALNMQQWDNGAHCNAAVTIVINGKTVHAQIVDRCEKCGYNNLDFTDGLFEVWADLGVGTLHGDWEYGNGAPPPKPSPTPSRTHHSSTTTKTSSVPQQPVSPSISQGILSSCTYQALG
ncbi:hypothetical protein GALMADRAFT_204624 [Galerina marginata CBS 339.88]|uniref:RlpA-like protein double-psi beta-barrel domain-containing protein n=1 Tax=Galerina marginata (strain CBS 339.88) TaxID=685588 RepID=A0A067TP91_GALM3|nr:hypothetical protein GALMADRAFT_204624 [Galerina marginata CBS 339.88]